MCQSSQLIRTQQQWQIKSRSQAEQDCIGCRKLFFHVKQKLKINFTKNLFSVKDGEHCLDRLYGGYFPDWTCGGQWNNMMAFLTTLFTNCHHANVHLAVFLNGALEASRFQKWVQDQMKIKANVNQVLKHLTKRMTPPPKVFWVPPCSVKLLLRLAIRSLNGTIINRWVLIKKIHIALLTDFTWN